MSFIVKKVTTLTLEAPDRAPILLDIGSVRMASLTQNLIAMEIEDRAAPVPGSSYPSWPASNTPDVGMRQVIALCAIGMKIDAIKLHRSICKSGLKEAKDFVEALEVELQQALNTAEQRKNKINNIAVTNR